VQLIAAVRVALIVVGVRQPPLHQMHLVGLLKMD
jgi:hypothetical protein